ncbi:hypothetical protein THRCLA_20891 [Thraustotheca clavata]|uniref:EF-hand domain-containing protein n=1 Tax=Thraustotheca clavata TaxID=74557 RepID=A0A1W0A2C4_9STRA|nr:hypothetical protein THRCLA_20891 [Thraustotheca clavata]
MADVQAAIDKCIADIWATFDQDNNGYLDREETRNFIESMAEAMSQDGTKAETIDFDSCFDEYDKNHDGRLSRDEMRVFVKQMMGLQ